MRILSLRDVWRDVLLARSSDEVFGVVAAVCADRRTAACVLGQHLERGLALSATVGFADAQVNE